MKKSFLLGTLLLVLNACSGQQQLLEGQQEITLNESLQYYLYLPEGYASSSPKSFGILLFLHGGGESGAALEEVKKNGPPKLLVEGKQFPFLVLAPQNPYAKKWWNVHAVNQLLDSIVETYEVDPNRIYLTGLSRGGSAAWDMAVQYPEKFAALAVVCGMAPQPYAHWLDKGMPIWVFHGDQDPVIPVSESDTMVDKLRSMGFDVRYTRYQGVGHNSWEAAYTTDELYEWMHSQKRIE